MDASIPARHFANRNSILFCRYLAGREFRSIARDYLLMADAKRRTLIMPKNSSFNLNSKSQLTDCKKILQLAASV